MDRFRIALGFIRTRLPSDVHQGAKSSPVSDNKDGWGKGKEGTGAAHLMKWSSNSIGIASVHTDVLFNNKRG